MRKQIAYVWVVLFSVILSVVLLYAPQPATTQDQDNTWKRFESDRADLLTNSGLIALRILNGAVHVDPGSLGKGLDLDRPRFDRLSNEVMVNNPDEDVNTFYGDLSLQSETATAGFGNTVLVAFNDDGEIF